MTINELQARQGNVNLTLEIVELEEPREFEKFGKKGRVSNAVAKDATGTIKLTLWNEDIDKVKAGDSVKIENGWVGEWQGELQLSTGKFGKLEVLSSGADSATPDEKLESEVLNDKGGDEGEHILTDDEKETVEEEVIEDMDK